MEATVGEGQFHGEPNPFAMPPYRNDVDFGNKGAKKFTDGKRTCGRSLAGKLAIPPMHF
jgi:hypothetical protein